MSSRYGQAPSNDRKDWRSPPSTTPAEVCSSSARWSSPPQYPSWLGGYAYRAKSSGPSATGAGPFGCFTPASFAPTARVPTSHRSSGAGEGVATAPPRHRHQDRAHQHEGHPAELWDQGRTLDTGRQQGGDHRSDDEHRGDVDG